MTQSIVVMFILLVVTLPWLVSSNFANQPSGACCIIDFHPTGVSTECIEVPETYCRHIHGDYINDFIRCIPNRAHPCVGACCTERGCEEVVESHCNELHGIFTRAGTRCNNTGNFCPPNVTGACCYKNDPDNPHQFGSCTVETFIDCYRGRHHVRGESWVEAGHCDIPGICPFLLVPYQESLPIPKVMKPYEGKTGCQGVWDGDYEQIRTPQSHQKPRAEYELQALPILHKYYPFFPNGQAAFAYEGQIPGPVFETCVGVPIEVKYVNGLPMFPHPLGFDSCIHGSDFLENVPYSSVHLHGSRDPTRYDGWPEILVYPGEYYEYYYENLNMNTMLFYHDHALGITRKNVMMGLVGIYFVRSPNEPNLPRGEFEVPLLLQDKSFTFDDGRVDISYPPNFEVQIPFAADDFPGYNAIVNGVVNPYMDVASTQYRFRIVNGANSRSWLLHFVIVNEHGTIEDVPFLVIGSDQGFVQPQWVTRLTLTPAERADVIFDFSSFKAGDNVWLTNDAPFPFPFGNPRLNSSYYAIDSSWDLPELVEFRVNGTEFKHMEIPNVFHDFHRLPPSSASVVRSFMIEDEWFNHTCNPHRWFLKRFNVDRHPEYGFRTGGWDAMDYIKENFIPIKDTTEIWEFWNPGDESHPMHLHGWPFQIVGHHYITVDNGRPETMRLTPHETPLEPTETAWKDTIEVHPKTMFSIIILFDFYTGKFPLHCHILEHEDNEMMRQFRVMDPHKPCHIVSASHCGNGVCEAANGENCQNCPFDCVGGHNFCCGWGIPDSNPHFIGCGPLQLFQQGQCGVCQRFKPQSNFELVVSCRTDYVDQCCYDDWCDY